MSEEVQATPAAEGKADELGVDVAAVEGSGVEGKVLVGDVEAAAEGGGDAPEATTQGDLVPDADEHPVDTTPPPPKGSEDQGPRGDAHEPMNKMDERGEPNTRGIGGGDGTVAHQ